MLLLTLKLVLAPLLVAGGSAAQRRWGQAVGGRLVGLPLTSLPLLFILAVAQGTRFAAAAAGATLAGVSAQAVLTWVYARAASGHGPLATTGAAVAAFAVTAGALALLSPGPVVAALLATITLGALLHYWPGAVPARGDGTGRRQVRPAEAEAVVATAEGGRSTTGVRMLLAGIFSLVVSELARPLGPDLAGLVTALPVLSLVMFALTHHDDGADGVEAFSHGVQRGGFSVITALLVLTLALPTGHVVLAFGAAVLASVLAQVAVGLADHHVEPVDGPEAAVATEVGHRRRH
jgi:hypothetical protein